MKLRKNVNINSLIERLKQIQSEAGVLISSFNEANTIFNNTKLGVNELNFGVDEEIARFRTTYDKIEELIRSL